jgi:hypothetical protein
LENFSGADGFVSVVLHSRDFFGSFLHPGKNERAFLEEILSV